MILRNSCTFGIGPHLKKKFSKLLVMEPESPVCPGPSSKRPRNAVQDNVGGSVSGIESSYQNLEPTVRLNDLTVLYDPPVDVHPVIADVIFVHGLQGHAQKTWQSTVQLPARNRSIFNVSSILSQRLFSFLARLSLNS